MAGEQSFSSILKERIPITDYAERLGFTVVRRGRYYSLKEHDSVIIDPEKNAFWRNSRFQRGFSGGAGSVIDFAVEFGGARDAREAMSQLSTMYNIHGERDRAQGVGQTPRRTQAAQTRRREGQPGTLALPQRAANNNAAFRYLLHDRGIHRNVIRYFLARDMLYQDARNNCVFKTDNFACLRSTGSTRFVGDVQGSDYNECFYFRGSNAARKLIVTESVIDTMSVMSYLTLRGKKYTDYCYLALSGTNKLESVFHHLEKEGAALDTVILSLDSDEAGHKAADTIQTTLTERFPSVSCDLAYPPSGKDWNDYIKTLDENGREVRQESQEPEQAQGKPTFSVVKSVDGVDGMETVERYTAVDGNREIAGTLSFRSMEGSPPHISMIETEEAFRRQGVATLLLQSLQADVYPREIRFGMTTPEGTELLNAVTVEWENPQGRAAKEEYARLQGELAGLQETLDTLNAQVDGADYDSPEVQAIMPPLREAGERWQEVYDKIRDMERNGIEDIQPTVRYVRLPEWTAERSGDMPNLDSYPINQIAALDHARNPERQGTGGVYRGSPYFRGLAEQFSKDRTAEGSRQPVAELYRRYDNAYSQATLMNAGRGYSIFHNPHLRDESVPLELVYQMKTDTFPVTEQAQREEAERIFVRLNDGTPHPANYYGVSLMVGDVVVFHDDFSFTQGDFHAYRVDSFGFQQADELLTPEMIARMRMGLDVRKEAELWNQSIPFFLENGVTVDAERAAYLAIEFDPVFRMADIRDVMAQSLLEINETSQRTSGHDLSLSPALQEEINFITRQYHTDRPEIEDWKAALKAELDGALRDSYSLHEEARNLANIFRDGEAWGDGNGNIIAGFELTEAGESALAAELDRVAFSADTGEINPVLDNPDGLINLCHATLTRWIDEGREQYLAAREQMTIREYSCYVVDRWEDSGDSFILGQAQDDPSFYYVRATTGDTTREYEYDHKPTRLEAFERHLDQLSAEDIDRHEAEYGADGYRAFPGDAPERTHGEDEIAVVLPLNNPVNGELAAKTHFVRLTAPGAVSDMPLFVGTEAECRNVVQNLQEGRITLSEARTGMEQEAYMSARAYMGMEYTEPERETEREVQKREYVVTMSSGGGTVHDFTTFPTREEAEQFINDNNGVWRDENDFEWGLSIDEREIEPEKDIEYQVGQSFYVDGKRHEITRMDDWNVYIMDRTVQNPEPRTVSRGDFETLLKQDERNLTGDFEWVDKQGAQPEQPTQGLTHGEDGQESPRERLARELMEGVTGTMNTEKYRTWLDTSSRLFTNNYSFRNAMLIFLQKPESSYCMGYEQWKEYGRQVAKGAQGMKIFVPVIAYEKQDGALFRMIKNNLSQQLKDNPNLDTATYKVGISKISFTLNRAGVWGLQVNGKDNMTFANETQVKRFIQSNVLNKVPMYFNVGTVFDVKDTIVPEHLWVKRGFTKDEMVRDEKGKSIKNKRGEYKIVNTPERQARFNTAWGAPPKEQDPAKMAVLLEALKAVAERNGVPVREVEKDADETLKGGAKGYYSRATNSITLDNGLQPTEKAACLLHEMGHADLHGDIEKLSREMGEKVPREMREVQAESVAYATAKQFGIETDTSSFQYIAAWSRGTSAQDLARSMDVIYNETRKLTREIAAELDVRGLSLDLSEKPKESLLEDTRKQIAASYMARTIAAEDKNRDVLTELPKTAAQYEGKREVLDNLAQQQTTAQENGRTIEEMKGLCDRLLNSTDRAEQDMLIAQLDGGMKRMETAEEKIATLSGSFMSLAAEQNPGRFDGFLKDPEKTVADMKEAFPALFKDLSPAQVDYIAKSEYIQNKLAPLLKEDASGERFAQAVTERAAAIPQIAARNGSFVEVQFCEQWTDKPIVQGGALLHPNVANAIIKQGETQTGKLRRDAENKGDYFPYTKCRLTVFTLDENKRLDSYYTRVDIGDGYQKSLTDFIHKDIGADSPVSKAFDSAIREPGAKEKVLYNEPVQTGQEPTKETAQPAKEPEQEKPDRDDKTVTLDEAKREVAAEKSEKPEPDNQEKGRGSKQSERGQ